MHGEVLPASILGVSGTSLTVNNQQRFLVDVEYQSGGESRRKKVNAYGQSVQFAQSLFQTGEETQVLVDPEKPDDPIWIGQLVNWAS
jgi:hypothetical protein